MTTSDDLLIAAYKRIEDLEKRLNDLEVKIDNIRVQFDTHQHKENGRWQSW